MVSGTALLGTLLFDNVFEILLLQVHRCYEGARPIIISGTRLRIDFVQTLRRPHIAFVRFRAELTETSIAVNHSMNNSVTQTRACLAQKPSNLKPS